MIKGKIKGIYKNKSLLIFLFAKDILSSLNFLSIVLF